MAPPKKRGIHTLQGPASSAKKPAPKRSPAKKAPKTGVHTLSDMPGHHAKASSSSSGKGIHILADMEESPAKRVRKDLDATYEEDAHSSDDFHGLSDEVESSDNEELEKSTRLGRPTMEEAEQEIDDTHHGSEDSDGNVVVKEGGIPRDVVKKRAREHLKDNGVHQKKRFFGLINRHATDAQADKGKDDDEPKDVLDWDKEDHGARYKLVPDPNGTYESLGNGLSKSVEGKRTYRRAVKTGKDNLFKIERATR
ncbi:MAG: hypothetical protein LQ349_008158 [Xanthoria aureola]|nr:MAG: hypothetical protein LQ349_008158 [Xanthoria aureola]